MGLWVLVAAVAALSLLGGALGVGLLVRGAPAGSAVESGPPSVGDDVKTSFGVIAVESAQMLKGLTAKDLAGMTHGIQNRVNPAQLLVQVGVSFTNLLDHTIRYSPNQFRLRIGKETRTRAVKSLNLYTGTLQPDANISARLSFIAPRDGSKLALEFRDRGRASPIVIELGSTDRAKPGDDRAKPGDEHAGDGH
jgi:hypothetical protein